MNGTIARIRNVELRRKTFLCEHTYTTHEMEIVMWDRRTDGIDYCFTIASFNQEGEIVSCGNRLLTYISDDFEAVQDLASIAAHIIECTDNVEIGTWKPEIREVCASDK
jgi:hypothetical protein